MLWADTGKEPEVAFDLRRELAARLRALPRGSDDWSYAAAWCLEQHIDRGIGQPLPQHQTALADTYRALYPNPYVPLAWDLAWFTSTVRALAAHIYNSRKFDVMPILADALQDAGCDDEQVLARCRGAGPHARGCWVLDAVLGKT
jgi:hypothetical protein